MSMLHVGVCQIWFIATASRISATIAPINLSLRLRCVPSGFTASSEQPSVSFQSLAFAVGHDEHPLSLVRSANFSRAEYSPRRAVTESFQFCNDFSQPKGDVSFDVLEEADSGSQNANAICDGWPEVPLVFGSESLTGCAEGLAGITAREDVHLSRKLCPREGLEIAPDWSRIKLPAFHAREKEFDGGCFPLTVSDCAQVADNSRKPKVDASVSCAEAEMSDFSWFGIIHMVFWLHLVFRPLPRPL